jgi:hypothetical protein
VATQTPIVFSGTLQDPADQSLPPDPIPFNFSGQYTQKSAGVLNLTGSGTIAIPFGTIGAPGAKLFCLRYDAGQQGAQAVLLTLNGGNQPEELTPGGMKVTADPAPTAGITAASLAYTAPCQVRYWIYA